MSEQVFIQIKKYAHFSCERITVKDICSLYCENETIANKLNSLTIYKFNGDKKRRVVLSSLFIIRVMQENCPKIAIIPIGPTDIVIKYEPHPVNNKIIDIIKVFFVCMTIFVGAGFSLVAFNSDVNLDLIFSTLQEKLMIADSTDFAVMEISYSLGIPIGIGIFYNHFGKKKLSSDPTPLEIEMRLYENDIIDSIVDGDNRKEDS